MTLEILEKVKEFLVRLVKDRAFRAKLQTDRIDEFKKAMQEDGYNFSKEEFETATIKILELKELGEFHELSEGELVASVGGITQIYLDDTTVQPMYGVITRHWKPKPRPYPKPIDPQPMYGVVIQPIKPIYQPMYGVVVSTDQL